MDSAISSMLASSSGSIAVVTRKPLLVEPSPPTRNGLPGATRIPEADGGFARMIVIPAVGLLNVSLVDFRNNVRDLRAIAQQLEATRGGGLESLSAAREDIVPRVRVCLEGALTDLRSDDHSQVADELASLAQETVRPLSHELAWEVARIRLDLWAKRAGLPNRFTGRCRQRLPPARCCSPNPVPPRVPTR